MSDLILGTAGHIDHGKTALVRALTGIDTDRLPEEKRRGITIDLGFALLDLEETRLGVVDVPGHDRFIGNMLAGATGIDLVLLVVAADEGIKPQTREHLDILALLGVSHGVVALTKCDQAAPQRIQEVERSIRELLANTRLNAVPYIQTSALTGTGIDDLREALRLAADAVSQTAGRPRGPASRGPFRLPIDRAFTLAGHGAVVTGSVASGVCQVGEELQLLPQGVAVRVRGLQRHDQSVNQIARGQRGAINLAGVRHEELSRGQELCTPGYLAASRCLTVRLQHLPGEPPLRQRSRVRLHLGAMETVATVLLLEHAELPAGGEAWAQLLTSDPVTATWRQPFVLRQLSPPRTIGGGRVIDPTATRLRRTTPEQFAALQSWLSADPLTRAASAVYFCGWRPWQASDLARQAGVDEPAEILKKLVDDGLLRDWGGDARKGQLVHRQAWDEACRLLLHTAERMIRRAGLSAKVEESALVSRLAPLASAEFWRTVLQHLAAAGRLTRAGKQVSLPERPKLSQNEQKLYDRIVALHRDQAYQPPTSDELAKLAPRGASVTGPLVELAIKAGDLVNISPQFCLHATHASALTDLLSVLPAAGWTVSQLRDCLQTSRKFAVPICEYLDRAGLTRRDGDLRRLA